MMYLAVNASEDKKLDIKNIATELNIPQHFTSKILQQLCKQGLLSSIKGPGGGYFLSKNNLETPLIKVIECLDGASVLDTCILGLPQCDQENPCPLHKQYMSFKSSLFLMMRDQNLDELAKKISIEGQKF